MKTALALLSQTYDEWRLDGAPQIAAALTYYVFLSLAPMLVLTVSLVGRYLGRSTVTGRVLEQAQALAGPAGAGIVRELVSAAQPSALGTLASVVALVVALFGSMRLFAQLRIAFDRMWNIPRADPPDGDFWTSAKWGFSSFGKDNLASFLMVIAVGGLLVISVALSSALAVAAGQIAPPLRISPAVLHVTEYALSVVLITALFALVYRVLPRTSIGWKDVWVGAGMTALLFTLGRVLLGIYFSHASPGSAYGAAGSVVAFLVWANLSLQLILFGAEFTHVWTYTHGSRASA